MRSCRKVWDKQPHLLRQLFTVLCLAGAFSFAQWSERSTVTYYVPKSYVLRLATVAPVHFDLFACSKLLLEIMTKDLKIRPFPALKRSNQRHSVPPSLFTCHFTNALAIGPVQLNHLLRNDRQQHSFMYWPFGGFLSTEIAGRKEFGGKTIPTSSPKQRIVLHIDAVNECLKELACSHCVEYVVICWY